VIAEVDLNADLGESFGNWRSGEDEALLGVVSSANIACGFHAGDPTTVRATTRRAAEQGVAVGAHVSYPDLAGFGRRFLDMSREELTDAMLYQLGALAGFARVAGTRMTYVKPHGALYNALLHHEEQALAVVDAVRAFDDELAVLHLPDSELRAQSERSGLRVVREAFADRMYSPDGSLAPRREPGSVLHDAAAISARVRRMVVDGEVVTTDGSVLRLAPESVCVHGDTPEAARIAGQVRQVLVAAGAQITAFAPAL
jgi:UPF0271 protein